MKGEAQVQLLHKIDDDQIVNDIHAAVDSQDEAGMEIDGRAIDNRAIVNSAPKSQQVAAKQIGAAHATPCGK